MAEEIQVLDNNVIPRKQEIIREENTGRFVKGLCPTRTGGRKHMPAAFKALAQEYTEEALLTLGSILSDKKAKNADRIKAATYIIDRVYGLPSQAITGGVGTDGEDMPLRIEEICRLLGGSR